ncbi:hypothetical protein GALMADRAFT_254544, partial [Galerina marginata CBS 339.88]
MPEKQEIEHNLPATSNLIVFFAFILATVVPVLTRQERAGTMSSTFQGTNRGK